MKKIIKRVIPPISSAMASPFCSCLSSILLAQNSRINLNAKNSSNRLSHIYDQTLTASGLAFSYVYKEKNTAFFDKTEYYTSYDDEWIKYAMNYGKCRYRIIASVDHDYMDEIVGSINHDMPVLVEGLCDTSWCLVLGYDDKKQIFYGYHAAKCGNCNPCINCVKTRINSYEENGMYNKFYNIGSIKRIIIIDGFDAKPYNYRAYIDHWLSIIQQQPRNGFLFGADAYDAMINLLENISIFNNDDEQEFMNVYRFILTNSFLPECRHCLGIGTSNSLERKALLDHMGFTKLSNPVVHQKLTEIKTTSFKMHNIGWSYWAALSAKKVYPIELKKYIDQFKSYENRKKAIALLGQLKAQDIYIMNNLKDILVLCSNEE